MFYAVYYVHILTIFLCLFVHPTQLSLLLATGLTLTDATALLGAHSLGFGHEQFSGHHGMWADEEVHAVTFDKHYYEELMLRAWRFRDPENSRGRNFVASEGPQTIVDQMTSMLATEKQDWTWGGGNGGNARYGCCMCIYYIFRTFSTYNALSHSLTVPKRFQRTCTSNIYSFQVHAQC